MEAYKIDRVALENEKFKRDKTFDMKKVSSL
jgi:hypothetical protein